MASLFLWEIDNDPGTGRTFFVYRPTGQSQWDLPESLVASANAVGYDVEVDPGRGALILPRFQQVLQIGTFRLHWCAASTA